MAVTVSVTTVLTTNNTMNKTDNVTQDCNVYSPGGSPVPAPLLWVGLVHSYCVIVFGTLGKCPTARLVEAMTQSTLYLNVIKVKTQQY